MTKRPATVRDRVVELRKCKPSEVQDHPMNWRVHEAAQHSAMRDLFREVGYVKPVDVYIPQPGDPLVVAGKLKPLVPCLMDGHLRKADVPEDFELSLNVTDLNEAEALKYLATCDPLAALAGQDDDKLMELLANVDSDSAAVQRMLGDLVDVGDGDGEEDEEADGGGEQFQILITCEGEDQQRTLIEELVQRGIQHKAMLA
jgi:hypothetical protein